MQWWCAATGAAWEWRWVPYPGVWLFVGTLIALYAGLLRAAKRQSVASTPGAARPEARAMQSDGAPVPALRSVESEPVSRSKIFSYFAGVFALWVALDWPIGPLGAGYLASVHMVQFLLIAVLAPPLLLHGIPESAYRWLESRPLLLRWLNVLTHPVVALAMFTVLIGATHWPRVVDTMMSSQLGSFTLDVTWLMAGLLFSWPVAAPVPSRPWLTYPVKMGHLLAGSLLNTGVFVFLTFSALPVYAIYELAPPITVLSAREDQRLAGLLMKMGSAPVMWTWMSILFFRWYREDARDEEEATEKALRERPRSPSRAGE